MAAVDFITALGRLLQDGQLRDSFSVNPAAVAEQLGLAEGDRPAFLRLLPDDLEFQANVLVRKRFDLVREALARTCSKLGADAWPEFRAYGRASKTASTRRVVEDVAGFCLHLSAVRPGVLDCGEWNRVRFAASHRPCAIRGVKDLIVRGRPRTGLQIFLRRRPAGWHEWIIYWAI